MELHLLYFFSSTCAHHGRGGWWYNSSCGWARLNGRWGENFGPDCMIWWSWKKKCLKTSMLTVQCDWKWAFWSIVSSNWKPVVRNTSSKSSSWYFKIIICYFCMLVIENQKSNTADQPLGKNLFSFLHQICHFFGRKFLICLWQTRRKFPMCIPAKLVRWKAFLRQFFLIVLNVSAVWYFKNVGFRRISCLVLLWHRAPRILNSCPHKKLLQYICNETSDSWCCGE